MSLQDRRLQYDLVQTFKVIRGFDKVYYGTWFDLVGNEPARLTRNTSDPLNIVKKPARTEIRKNFFSQRVIDKWNAVPHDLKRVKTVNTFKTRVNEMIKMNKL